MTLWNEKFHDLAEAEFGKTYGHKWWSRDFAESHPKVTFLMQVLNRHIVSPSLEYAEELREHIREQDKAADYAVGSGPIEFLHPIDLARLAFTAFMFEERALGLRFAVSSVMTADDRRDFALLLMGVTDDRSRI